MINFWGTDDAPQGLAREPLHLRVIQGKSGWIRCRALSGRFDWSNREWTWDLKKPVSEGEINGVEGGSFTRLSGSVPTSMI